MFLVGNITRAVAVSITERKFGMDTKLESVTIVNEHGELLFDRLVLPYNEKGRISDSKDQVLSQIHIYITGRIIIGFDITSYCEMLKIKKIE